MYTLFIDDERYPTPGLTNVKWAKDCDDATRILNELGCPEVISFDHDLWAARRWFNQTECNVGIT